MRPVLATALMFALGACGVGGETIGSAKASGVDGDRRFDLSGFEAVSLTGPDDVTVRVGPAFAVSARGDTGVLDTLDIKVDGKVLEIGRKRGVRIGDGARNSIKVLVTLPRLSGATIAGSGDMAIDRVDGAFSGDVVGSGTLKVAAISAPEVRLGLTGSGDAELAGTADRLKVSLTGSGNAKVAGLKVGTLDASVAGSGNVEATAETSADVSVLGSGNAIVHGPATCKSRTMGSGTVKCKA
ncbi:hypothetical protein FHS96_003139 [Sphingomonas zeicaulis]|uniref:head GIN domain-containing protein n=1 Tax=Sphingomonas zeicaulis TaxID=1632740 RepID=UPI003D1D524D